MASTTNLGLTKIQGGDYVDPEVFNTNFDLIDPLGKAYIADIGTSNGWQYIKLTNGFMVCAATSGGTTTSDTTYNVKKNYPFAFSESPHLIATGGVEGNVYSGIRHVGNATSLADVWIGTDSTTEGRSWWIHMVAFGTLASTGN